MMSNKYADKKSSTAQTKIRVTPAILEEEEVRVWTNHGTQTYASAKPTSSDSSILSLLKFVPYQDLVKNSIRQVDLPHKTRLIWSTNRTSDENFIPSGSKNPSQSFDDESIQGVLRKGSLNKRFQNNMAKSNLDADIQTNLSVTPHVLEEDEVATVYAQIFIQTSLTFTPDTSISEIVPKLKENLEHQGGISASDKANPERHTTDEIQREIENVEAKIEKILDRTVTNLQLQLDNILKIYETSLHEASAEKYEIEEKIAILDEENEEKTEEAAVLSENKSDLVANEGDEMEEVVKDERLDEESEPDKTPNEEILTAEVSFGKTDKEGILEEEHRSDTKLSKEAFPEEEKKIQEEDKKKDEYYIKKLIEDEEAPEEEKLNERMLNGETDKALLKYDTFDEDSSSEKLLEQTVIEAHATDQKSSQKQVLDEILENEEDETVATEMEIREAASADEMEIIEETITKSKVTYQYSEGSKKEVQVDEIPWFCRCEQEKKEEGREQSEAVILEIISGIDSSIVLPKPGHKHCDVQTDEVICECTGTNFVEGDNEATHFNEEGTGSAEKSCQCSVKVNASIQDGVVESEPHGKSEENRIIPCECSLSEVISEGQGDQISQQSSFVECECDQKSVAKDQVSQQGDGPTVEEEEFGPCDCSEILSKETLSQIISQLCNCSTCECKEEIESILKLCYDEEKSIQKTVPSSVSDSEEDANNIDEDSFSSICDCEEEISIKLLEKEAVLSLASDYEKEEECEEEKSVKIKDTDSTIECECEENEEKPVLSRDSDSTLECECEDIQEKEEIVKIIFTDSTIECDCEEISEIVKNQDTSSTIECDCEEENSVHFQRKLSAVVANDKEIYILAQNLSFNRECDCSSDSLPAFKEEPIQPPHIPDDHMEPLSGDNKDNKKRNVILCECHPTVAGAAPPILQSDDERRPEAYPSPQSLERLCQENPNNALAFIQRLQECALTPEGRDYIRNLDPETLKYLIQAGFKDEITKLLQDIPSYYVFKTDPVYMEDYMKNLVIEDGPVEVLQTESNLSLVPDPNEIAACTGEEGVELPWFRIRLPQAGTYELKQMEKKIKEIESQVEGGGDVIVPETEENAEVVQARAEEAQIEKVSVHETSTDEALAKRALIEGIIKNIHGSTEDIPQSVPDENAPTKAVLDESAPTEAVPDENAPTEAVPDENAPTEAVPDENAPIEAVPDKNTLDEEVADENAPDEAVPDENTPGENALEEAVSDEDIQDEEVPDESAQETASENSSEHAEEPAPETASVDGLDIASACVSVDEATGNVIENIPEVVPESVQEEVLENVPEEARESASGVPEVETAVVEPVQKDTLIASKIEALTSAPVKVSDKEQLKKHPLLAVAGKPIYFEPYLESLNRQYASDDDDEGECSAKTEMPWKDILLRTNCQIISVPRKTPPKPIQTEEEEEEEELCVCEVSDDDGEDADDESCECENDSPKNYQNCICEKVNEQDEQTNIDNLRVTCIPSTCKNDEPIEYASDDCVCATKSSIQPDATTCTPVTCQDRLETESNKLIQYLDDDCTCAAEVKLKRATSAPVDVARKPKQCPTDLGPGIKTCKSLGSRQVGSVKPLESPKELIQTSKEPSCTCKITSLPQLVPKIEEKTLEQKEPPRRESVCECTNLLRPPTIEEKTPEREKQLRRESVCKCADLVAPPKIDLQPVKLPCSCSKTSKPDPVLTALEAYQAEMKPLRETLNKLREKIRDLNLPEMNAICGCNKTNNIDDLFATHMYGQNQMPTSSSGYVSSSVRLNNVRNARTIMQIKRHPPPMPQPGMVHPNGRFSGMPPGLPPGMPMGLPYFNPMGFQGYPPQPNFSSSCQYNPAGGYESQHDFVSVPCSTPYSPTYCDSATAPAMEDKACSCDTSKMKIKKSKKKKKKKIRQMVSSTEDSENESCRCVVAMPQPEQDVGAGRKVSEVKFRPPCEECGHGYVDVRTQEGPPGRYRMKIALRLTAPDGTITTPKPVIMYHPQIASDAFSKTGSSKTFNSKSTIRLRTSSNSPSKSKPGSVTVKQNVTKNQSLNKETNECEQH